MYRALGRVGNGKDYAITQEATSRRHEVGDSEVVFPAWGDLPDKRPIKEHTPGNEPQSKTMMQAYHHDERTCPHHASLIADRGKKRGKPDMQAYL